MSNSIKKREMMRVLFGGFANLVELGLYVVCLFTLIGYFSAANLVFDLCCHFRVQYFLILIPCMVFMLWRKRRIQILICIAGIVANGLSILPLYLKQGSNVAAGSNVASGSESVVKILDVNLNSRNDKFSELEKLVNDEQVDLICWQEFSPEADLWAQNHLLQYSYSARLPRRDNFGIAMFSKLPVSNFKAVRLSDVNIATIFGEIHLSNKTVQVICTHAYPGIKVGALTTRNLQLRNLAQSVKATSMPLIICGDLNTTSWSSAFQALIKESGLQDSRIGLGVQPSWPTYFPLLQIPIDHILVSGNIQVLERRIGPSVGSDHWPVIAKLAVN